MSKKHHLLKSYQKNKSWPSRFFTEIRVLRPSIIVVCGKTYVISNLTILSWQIVKLHINHFYCPTDFEEFDLTYKIGLRPTLHRRIKTRRIKFELN